MKSKRMSGVLACIIIFLLIIGIVITTISSPTIASPSAQKSIKIGFITWTTHPPGIGWAKGISLLTEMTNKAGGLELGGEKYIIETIIYDSDNNQNKAMAAANRLIFHDKAKYVLSDTGSGFEAMLPITEENKIVSIGISPLPDPLLPKNKYTFMAAGTNCLLIVTSKWFMEKYPNKRKVIFIAPDMKLGRMVGGFTVMTLKSLGLDVQDEYFPPNQTDLSSLGSKIKSLNPDVVITPVMQPIKAIRDSGWEGQLFCQQPYTAEELLSQASADDLEGFIGLSSPCEFEPALNKAAQDFKTGYIQKYGKWENTDLAATSLFECLLAAFRKAGSFDTDKVAAAISSGLTWDGPAGQGAMIPRPDLGNDRHVDSVVQVYMKIIKKGKAELLDTISIQDSKKYYTDYLSTKAPPPIRK